MSESPLRGIPSVEKALQAIGPLDLPRPLAVDAIRRELAAVRGAAEIPAADAIMARLRAAIDELRALRLQPVINATGIALHTNFGRAPLPGAALDLLAATAGGYSNLEYDLAGGKRGSRGAYLERCLALLCEAEAATAVNNCAAALVLILRHFTAGTRREVVISRGEMIQIGGGFRIPEIMEASGATLREVGTTNRTVAADYAAALGDNTALVLKVHRSNFYMTGFVETPPTEELAALAARAGVPLVEDLGSGAIFDTGAVPGLEREPTPAEILRRGVDLVCFSGDKLFGGPQAGIIAGRAELVAALKRDPLFRALRCDKLVFAALQATAELHLSDPAAVPAHALLGAPAAELRARAEAMLPALPGFSIVETEAEVGGGALPRSRVPSIALAWASGSLECAAAQMRGRTPPVIGYISDKRFLFDLRTVFVHQDQTLLAALQALLL